MSEARCVAHPNVALSKYWGKREGGGNIPAVPSLSVTLAGLETTTDVRFDEGLEEDQIAINGRPADATARARVVALLDRVRRAAGEPRRAHVRSKNDFPTASGLASSASGFSALALAAVRAASLDWDVARVSDLARRTSASAARSLFGGFVELDAGSVSATEDAILSARPVASVDHIPLTVLVCVTTEAPKAVASSEGMRVTMARSPYAHAWLECAPRLHARLREALLARDFASMGELAESSAFAMHASAIAAGVTYWNGATLDAIRMVHALRREGTAAFASIDAGPHVKVLARSSDAAKVQAAMAAVPGVLRIIEAHPGDGARIVATRTGQSSESSRTESSESSQMATSESSRTEST